MTGGGAVERFRWAPDPEAPRAANAAAVTQRAAQVAGFVAAVPAGDLALVLGGDCTVGVGTVAGLARRTEHPALVYFDRHSDLNVPSSTEDGALDWMGVAHMLDVEGTVASLAAIAGRQPMLSDDRVVFLGLGPHTAFEASVIADRGLPSIDVTVVASDPAQAARSALGRLPAGGDIAVHFDVDVVDFIDAPLAENTNRGPAPSLHAAGIALGELVSDPRVQALTVTEFNPHHGAEDGSTTARLVDALVGALSR